MATIQKEVVTRASPDQTWDAIRDIGALHTRLVPGFVIDTKVVPGARIVTFVDGATARERIVSLDEKGRRLVWTAEAPFLEHHNGSSSQRLPLQLGRALINSLAI
ncbi:SRPBCC family protein [Brucella pituitosa]|uniref:SRPBCC family protein n=1 Tax=Brucella pituitosa TaxID=571256 RepID=UPI003F4A8D93